MAISDLQEVQTIELGRQGENLATSLQFNLQEFYHSYGAGNAVLIHKRPGDTRPYIAAEASNSYTITWNLEDEDTAQAGVGQAEIRYYVGSVLKKSAVFSTYVVASIMDDMVERPGNVVYMTTLGASMAAKVSSLEAMSPMVIDTITNTSGIYAGIDDITKQYSGKKDYKYQFVATSITCSTTPSLTMQLMNGTASAGSVTINAANSTFEVTATSDFDRFVITPNVDITAITFKLIEVSPAVTEMASVAQLKQNISRLGDEFVYEVKNFEPVEILEETPSYTPNVQWTTVGTQYGKADGTTPYNAVEMIPVLPNVTYKIPANFRGFVTAYNDEKNVGVEIVTDDGYKLPREFKIPSGKFYIGISPRKTILETVTSILRMTPVGDETQGSLFHMPNMVSNKMFDKNVLCFGDSITGNNASPNDYPSRISDLLSCTATNVGFGGCKMAYQYQQDIGAFSMYMLADALTSGDFTAQDAQIATSTIPNASEHLAHLKSVDLDDIDIVTIWYGTNDIGNSTASLLDDDTDMYNTHSLCGALRYSIKKLLEAKPSLKIVVFTPMYRMFNSGLDVNHRTFADKDGTERTFSAYIDGIKNACGYFGIHCIDMYRTSGINEFNHTYYLADGTHPKPDVGQAHVATIVANSLLDLY